MWKSFGGVVKGFQETWGDGQEVTTGKGGDFTSVSEGGTHDNGVVAVLLVVVVDLSDGENTRVGLGSVLFTGLGLVPVQDSADERRDQGDLGFGTGDGLDEGEQQGQVTVDTVFLLQFLGGLDTFPGRGDLDEDSFLGDALGLVHVDDGKGLVDGGLLVEGQSGVDLGGHSAWDDLQDLGTELNKQSVKGDGGLFFWGRSLALGVIDGGVDQVGVLRLLGGSKDQRWVGGGILRGELGNGCLEGACVSKGVISNRWGRPRTGRANDTYIRSHRCLQQQRYRRLSIGRKRMTLDRLLALCLWRKKRSLSYI